MKFYICNTCGNEIVKIIDGSGDPVCCGKPMESLRPGTTDGAKEKHVPMVSLNETEDKELIQVHVQVGENPHPMESYHYIEWICIQTDRGFHLTSLSPNTEPVANFYINKNEKVLKVYEYCNLHKLWEGSVE